MIMRPCPSSPLPLSHSWLPSCSLHRVLNVSLTLIFSRCRRPSKWIPLLSAVCLCKTSVSDRASRREASWAQLKPCMRRRTFTASRDNRNVERFCGDQDLVRSSKMGSRTNDGIKANIVCEVIQEEEECNKSWHGDGQMKGVCLVYCNTDLGPVALAPKSVIMCMKMKSGLILQACPKSRTCRAKCLEYNHPGVPKQKYSHVLTT